MGNNFVGLEGNVQQKPVSRALMLVVRSHNMQAKLVLVFFLIFVIAPPILTRFSIGSRG